MKKIMYTIISLVLICLLSVTICLAGEAADNGLKEIIIEGNKRSLEAITSAKAKATISVKIIGTIKSEDGIIRGETGTRITEYEWYMKNKSFREAEYAISGNEKVLKSIIAFNGKQCYLWNPDENIGQIISEVLPGFGYVSRVAQSLGFTLGGDDDENNKKDIFLSKHLLLVGKENLEGVIAYKFIGFTDIKERGGETVILRTDESFWFAPQYNYQIIKWVISTPPLIGSKVGNITEYRVNSFYQNKDGICIPKDFEDESCLLYPDGKKEMYFQRKYILDDVEINTELDDSLFKLSFPENAKVGGLPELVY